MSDDTECCGMEIKRCAKIVAIIGIILSVCSFNLIGFVIYVLVYLGVDNNKPGYLLPAKICLVSFFFRFMRFTILNGD
uniref:Transmembrane protein n=1 Tax=Panagrolaimus sp. PS1159 TaxID=55785 RepID=A0AC35G5Q4_9BILA